MLNDALKTKIESILKPKTPNFVFTEDDVITLEIQKFIHEQHASSRIRKLFDSKNKNEKCRQQPMERICRRCNNIFIKTYPFSQVSEIITGFYKENKRFLCANCEKIEKEMQKNLLKNKNKTIKENTKEYIDSYLNPDRQWLPGVKTYQKINSLCLYNVDYNEIENYINSMDYNNFLQTPYWKAISEKVKKRAKWMCEMCGKNTSCLNVHHPDYSFHGQELQNIDRLKCLCTDCHEKFHFNKGEL